MEITNLFLLFLGLCIIVIAHFITQIFKLILSINTRIDQINSENTKRLNKIDQDIESNLKNLNKIIEMIINLKQHPFRKN
jgi:predicted PurR-regulated permease PerM